MSPLGFIFAASSVVAIPASTPTDTIKVPTDLFSLDAGDTFEIIENGKAVSLTIYSRHWEYGQSRIEFESPHNGLLDRLVRNDKGEVLTGSSKPPYQRTGWEREPGRWELVPRDIKGAPQIYSSTVANCAEPFLDGAIPFGRFHAITVTLDSGLNWQAGEMAQARPCDKITFTSPNRTESLIIDHAVMYGPGHYQWMGHIEGRKFAQSRFVMNVDSNCHEFEELKSCWKIHLKDEDRTDEDFLEYYQFSNDEGGYSSVYENRQRIKPLPVPIALSAIEP